jgi:DNA-binding HxlR family transcriptional regulator
LKGDMRETHRSGCPINLTLELLGDRWSLLILRDMIFGGARRYAELLGGQERIASNILAERLRSLAEAGLITRAGDPEDGRRAIYSLTEMAIELVPVFAAIGAWGSRWLPVSEALSIRARLMDQGGAPLLERFMAELRQEHLGDGSVERPTVREELEAAYRQVVAEAARA